MLKKIKYILPMFQNIKNWNRKKQVILLMIPNGEGWHYVTVKNYKNYQEE